MLLSSLQAENILWVQVICNYCWHMGWLDVAELTLTQSTRLSFVRATVSRHRKKEKYWPSRSDGLILSSCCLDISEDDWDWMYARYLRASVSYFLFQKKHEFDSDVESHRFRSLPEMSNRLATDLHNLEVTLLPIVLSVWTVFVFACVRSGRVGTISPWNILPHPCSDSYVICLCFPQLKPTLSQLHADLKLYKDHFDWLSNVSKKHHHPAVPKLEKMITEIKSVITMLHHQVTDGISRAAFKSWNEMDLSFSLHLVLFLDV